MSIALGALQNNQEALEVTSNNISNQNTQGYSRQVVNFSEGATVQFGSLQFGTGAQVDNIQSIRDQVLDFRIANETSTQSGLDTYVTSMNQVQANFNEAAGTGLQSAISGFFNSLSNLSTDPSNVSLRQSVLTAGQNLTSSFNTAANTLSNTQAAANQQVAPEVQQVNTLAQNVAALNTKISQAQASGQNTGSMEDQRNQLILQMSQITNISLIQGDHGTINIATAQGASLVVGGQQFNLSTATNATTGQTDIFSSDGRDITSGITGGSVGGLIQVRDQSIPQLTSQLDTLASGIATAVNNTQTAGTDLNGATGQNFFTIPAGVPGTAKSIQVNLTDPSQIAGSLNGSTGDNANIVAMSQLQNQNIVNGDTPLDFYSNSVAQLGSQIQQATTQGTTQDSVVQQLQAQRQNVSGVSLDEEAANLIQFQRAYQAAARIVNVVDEMTQTVINMGVGGT
jgi:flagellar hook-associated protein 1 FlgK